MTTTAAPAASFAAKAIFLALFLLALSLPQAGGAPAALAATLPGEAMAVEQQKQSAVALLKGKKYQEAYDVFMRLLREDPEDPDVNMGIAISAYNTENYAQALLAYERLLAQFPQDGSLRLGIARVYVALDEPESARLELEKAREYDPSLTDETVASILTALTSKTSRWQHRGQVSFGAMYDSNSNQGPNSNFLSLGGYNDLFVKGAKEKESWGAYASGSVEISYRLDESGNWWVMGDVFGYQRWNTSAGVTSNKNFSFGRASLGGRYLGENVLFDLRLKADLANQAHKGYHDQLISSYGPEATFAVSPHPNFQLITRVGLEERTYSESEDRDGLYWSAAQYARLFWGEANHEIMLGVGLFGNDPDVTAYRYLEVEPSLRLVFKLPYDLDFSPFVSYREERYDGPATGLETEDRKDKQWRSGILLVWNVSESWALDLSYQHVNNNSNSSLYEYDQDLVSLGTTLKF